MRHCHNCNRNYSDTYFRKHCQTNKHLKKFSVKNVYIEENILVNKIDNILNTIIKEHKRKFRWFYIVCKINNKKIIGYPKRVLLKYYDKDDMIDIEFNFYSNREDITFNYHMCQPKPMLETTIIKNLDKYPEKLKILDSSKTPYYKYLLLKYYGYCMRVMCNQLMFCVKDNWIHINPTEPDNNYKEILRNI